MSMRIVSSLVLAVLVAAPARAVPTTMTYAGLLEQSGSSADGTVDVTFRLFDASVAGTQLYTEDVTGLVVLAGDLVAELGNNALDDTILDRPELWLEVVVDGEVLLPRVRLNSVPYALRAEAAARAEDALTLGGLLPTDVVTHAQLQAIGLDAGLTAGAGITIGGGTVSLATNGVATANIADGAVTGPKLAASSVSTGNIVDGQVGTNDLANLAVTGAKVAAGTITSANIATDTIGAGNIATNGVGSLEILDGSVTANDLASNAVTTLKILDGSVSSAKLSGIEVNVFRQAAGCFLPSALVTSASCPTVNCGALTFTTCASANCTANSATTCPNVLVGKLLSAGN